MKGLNWLWAKKWRLIVVLVVVGFIILSVVATNRTKRLEAENKKAVTVEVKDSLTEEEKHQEIYRQEWGNPPEGFQWKPDGSLEPLGASELGYEDVAFVYIKALSGLDFSTAQKLSKGSKVIARYESYFKETTTKSYYGQFLRQVYTQALLSMESLKVENSAIFADGKRVVTFKVKLLDLTDKEFWGKDKDTIYKTMRSYNIGEQDNTKAKQYLYNYVIGEYTRGAVPKREVTVELVLNQVGDSWLIVDDTALYMACSYENGVNVVEHINHSYTEWLREDLRREGK